MTAVRGSVSIGDAIAAFIGAMEAAGMAPAEPIAQQLSSGDLIRFRCEGDKPGRKNGWAKLYTNERPAGAFGNYRLGVHEKWSSAEGVRFDPVDRERCRREWAAEAEKRAALKAETTARALEEARDIWSTASAPDPGHPYLVKKGMDGKFLRQVDRPHRQALAVPLYDASGQLMTLQFIRPDGSKRFVTGAPTAGAFLLMGDAERRRATVCIGEGFATMRRVHRATGHPCVAAFSTSNLEPVARLWRQRRPDLRFIICGDDDDHLPNNPGRAAAEAAAAAVGGRAVFPTREGL